MLTASPAEVLLAAAPHACIVERGVAAVLLLRECVDATAVLRLLVEEAPTRRLGANGTAIGRDVALVAVLRFGLFPLGDNLSDRLVGPL